LQKLENGSQARPMQVTEGASHLFIVHPLRMGGISNLFSTHPPTEERVQRLTSMNITPRF
jgi:heat shock protein HtpX